MRILLLTISAATYLAIGVALLFQAGRLPAASPPAAPQSTVAVAPPARTEEPGASTSLEAASPAIPAVLRVKTVRVDPTPPPTEVEDQQPPLMPEARQAEASMIDGSSPAPEDEPATIIPRRRAGSTHSAPTSLKTAHRAAKRKVKIPADEASASDGALSYAQRQPAPNP